MSEIILTRDVRLSLRAQAHHLDPVVLLGANGLTEAVMKEIDREEREAIYAQVAETLGAARVQMIGKLLIFWRPAEDEAEEDAAARILAAAAAAARIAASTGNGFFCLSKPGRGNGGSAGSCRCNA